jgi:hypothetical protein
VSLGFDLALSFSSLNSFSKLGRGVSEHLENSCVAYFPHNLIGTIKVGLPPLCAMELFVLLSFSLSSIF